MIKFQASNFPKLKFYGVICQKSEVEAGSSLLLEK